MHKNGITICTKLTVVISSAKEGRDQIRKGDSQGGFSLCFEQSHLFLQKRRMLVYLPDIYIGRKAGK